MDVALIERMCAAIEHRGPDARGTFVQEGVGLGVQRLRVIDLATGDQPIFNEDRSVVVVLNGEIYNFGELRERLRSAGHRFRTRTDTEVIVHLYEEEGPRCVESLHGMFAFAIWDMREQMLVIARDRVGKKPLFYSHRGDSLTFASELQGLLQDHEIPRALDHQALDCYYAYQYVPAPMTAFKAVRKIPPAHVLVYREGSVREERYWQLRYEPKVKRRNEPDLHEEILAKVEGAVRRRMISDVPLGAFLSGGVDSSAVVAAMARHSSEPVKTFSIGFRHERFDELPYARTVAQQFGTDHHEFVVEPSAIEVLPKIVRHYGEPFADASAIPSFYLAAVTRDHVTVALNGDGGDESFGGYNRYVANAVAGRIAALPEALRRALAATAGSLPRSPDPQSLRERARRFGSAISLTPSERYARYMSYFDRDQRDELYTPQYKAIIGESLTPAVIEQPWNKISGTSVIDAMLATDVDTYLPGDLLVKMDIATMAHSLEARSPLLDPEVMELAAALPANLKVRGMGKKVVFREALSQWLPRELLDRPKMGFGVPLGQWFRHELREYVREVLLDRQTLERGYFRQAVIHDLLQRHFDGIEDTSPRMWALLVGELWHREFVDRPTLVGSSPSTAGAAQRAASLPGTAD